MDDNPYASGKLLSDVAEATSDDRAVSTVRKFAAFTIAFLGGAMIWAVSTAVIGHAEPWDGNNGYYFLSVAVVSTISGLISGGKFWPAIVGAYLGQVVYCAIFYRPGGAFLPLILISVGIIGVVPSIIGTASSWIFLRSIRRR